ncbi:LacI family DNA-binding transcriptional regulator [Clostridium saccharobutylicum]|uniref:LacI family DNA-binding transcriptional regulator n=1 Tax=Clostridium saccharobutylicum TaxID=169679 RepID=UPI001809F647|nr:DNA-binding LacI/PurR family transcriptional regulator [Clostridium saccharobutylicum]
MATIKDVAKKAGVSVGSVSRFINNFEVKPKTRLAIEKAIKELDYEPNIYARGFKVNKTNTIALIIPTVWNPFFGELAFNIEKSLRDYGMKMILCNSGNDYEIELQYITMAKQNKVDGIISITYSDVDKYVHSNMPIISIDRYFSEDITYVTSDNFEGGRMAAEELMKSGCKSIAFIGRGSKIDNATRNRKKVS